MKALDEQVGGNHYKRFNEQPIALIMRCEWNYIQGNIAKYILRATFKNGQEDIDKAIHYCKLGLAFNDTDRSKKNVTKIKQYCKVNNLSMCIYDLLMHINLKEYKILSSKLSQKEFFKELSKMFDENKFA